MAKTKPTSNKSTPVNPDRMSTAQAARFLGLAEQTLRTWRHQGRENAPPYMRICGKIAYRQSALEAWLTKNTVGESKK